MPSAEIFDAESYGDEVEINDPFDPEDIDIVTRNPNVANLLSRLRTDRLDLEPEFQRRTGIWNTRSKSRLIESLLLKIPLPTMYAAEAQHDADSWIVVDGVQRLSTIASFVDPAMQWGRSFDRLIGLQYLTQYEGYAFHDLPARLRTRIEETEFVLNLIRRGTPEPVMFNIFARINTGGAPLTRQELRHALTPGPARYILEDLASSDEFKVSTGGRVPTSRMADREMVLRCIAFLLQGVESYSYRTDFDGFLSLGMRMLSDLSPKRTHSLENRFRTSSMTAVDLFGRHAFRRSLPGDRKRKPINKALYEAVMTALSLGTTGQQNSLMNRQGYVLAGFADLFEDPDFVSSISQSTGDPAKVFYRHSRVREVLHA